ncbi:hypothetical protein [Microbulbifer sp. PSTR4-B]|jgi:hypothetical protein|uniref:hypothetical protein n=1 Tax=Microbulbifer sp. PSTR4-B TaxID=3243396 RepID=UPI00403A6C08
MKFRIFLLTLLSSFYVACSFGEPMILEKKDTQFFTVKVIDVEHDTVSLLVSGLSFHSALSVSKISTEVEGGNLSVKVHLQPGLKGGSGSFEQEVIVPPSVSNVVFGNDKVKVWSRN